MTPVQVGEILAGKYRVERVLGHGGMGVVVAATHLQLAQQVALKFLLPDMLESSESVERFLREARAAAQIRGENVARVLDVGTLESGAPFMVMEYLDGTDLAQLLRSHGALPIATAADYLLQTCEALAEAHALGIVHRDLKPANLFLTRSPDGSALVKVLDFGISKMVGARADGADPARITTTQAVMGSPLYMSPEQITSSRDVDHRSDIWALGVILHELLAAQPPYMAETAPALMVAIAVNPPTPLRSHRPDAPTALEAIVARCLEKDRGRRYPDVAELSLALAPFASSGGAAAAERVRRVLGIKTDPKLASLPSSSPSLRPLPGANSSGNFDATATVGTASSWGGTAAALRRRDLRKWLLAGAGLAALIAAGVLGVRALTDAGQVANATPSAATPTRDAGLSATALPPVTREPTVAPAPPPRPEVAPPEQAAPPAPAGSRPASAPATSPTVPARPVRVKSAPPAAAVPPKPSNPRGKDLFNDLD